MLIIKLTEIGKNGITKTWKKVIDEGSIKDFLDLDRIALEAEDNCIDAQDKWR